MQAGCDSTRSSASTMFAHRVRRFAARSNPSARVASTRQPRSLHHRQRRRQNRIRHHHPRSNKRRSSPTMSPGGFTRSNRAGLLDRESSDDAAPARARLGFSSLTSIQLESALRHHGNELFQQSPERPVRLGYRGQHRARVPFWDRAEVASSRSSNQPEPDRPGVAAVRRVASERDSTCLDLWHRLNRGRSQSRREHARYRRHALFAGSRAGHLAQSGDPAGRLRRTVLGQQHGRRRTPATGYGVPRRRRPAATELHRSPSRRVSRRGSGVWRSEIRSSGSGSKSASAGTCSR